MAQAVQGQVSLQAQATQDQAIQAQTTQTSQH